MLREISQEFSSGHATPSSDIGKPTAATEFGFVRMMR